MKSYRVTVKTPGMTHHYLTTANNPDEACWQMTEQMSPLYREFKIIQVRQEVMPPPAFAGGNSIDRFDD